MAKKRQEVELVQTRMEVSYQAQIVGTTWEGVPSAYSYAFGHAPSLAEIKRKAGDFKTIDDWQSIEVITILFKDGQSVRRNIVRYWRNPASQKRYNATL
jgi:hypothetical protein